VQTGIGRTGTLFAYHQMGIQPDIMTVAKALGNGLPIGAMLTTDAIAAAFTPGTHASTFGGNPVVAAAAVASLEIILAEGFLPGVRRRGMYFQTQLQQLAARFPTWRRGTGPGHDSGAGADGERGGPRQRHRQKMFERGFLCNFAGNVALRFVPPLIVSEEEIDCFIAALADLLAEY